MSSILKLLSMILNFFLFLNLIFKFLALTDFKSQLGFPDLNKNKNRRNKEKKLWKWRWRHQIPTTVWHVTLNFSNSTALHSTFCLLISSSSIRKRWCLVAISLCSLCDWECWRGIIWWRHLLSECERRHRLKSEEDAQRYTQDWQTDRHKDRQTDRHEDMEE